MKTFPLSYWFSYSILAALLGYGLILGFAKPAEARMRFCNHSGEKLYVSWAWKHIDGDWRSEGHYSYEPGHCENVYDFPLRSRIYYFYAQNQNGYTTHGTSKKANRPFCVSSKAYEITNNVSSFYDKYHRSGGRKENCSELGQGTDITYRLEEFRQINTGRLGFRCIVYLQGDGKSSYKCSVLS